VRVKVRVVEEDPLERGRREVLNLGHTFGHAIEKVSEFGVRHGEAVAVGLVASAHLAAGMSRAAPALAERIARLLEGLGLPSSLPELDPAQVHRAMIHDKKRRGRTLRFVIPERVGRVAVVDDPGPEAVQAALRRVLP
jgi:3-dehydroquinate synthetase